MDKENVTETVFLTAGTNSIQLSHPTKDQRDSTPDVKQPTQTCIRSVTVHWDIPTKHLSDAEATQRPVPLPRIKSRKQAAKEEVEDPILVKLGDGSANVHSDPQDVSTNEYLKELLEVFSGGDERERRCDTVNQAPGEDAVAEMSSNHGQRNIWARIQAFENQTSSDDGNAAEPAKPQLPTRKPSVKPPVAAKPSVAFKPQVNSLVDGFSQSACDADVPQKPAWDPRPQPPAKPGGLSIKDELEGLLQSKAAVPEKLPPAVLSKADSFLEAGTALVPPTPPAKPFKEPLKPNLNINNHNSASLFTENEYMNTLSGT